MKAPHHWPFCRKRRGNKNTRPIDRANQDAWARFMVPARYRCSSPIADKFTYYAPEGLR